MEVVHVRCAGLDVHRETVVAQERRHRCGLAGRLVGAWADPGELRAAPTHPGASRLDANPEANGATGGASDAAYPEDP